MSYLQIGRSFDTVPVTRSSTAPGRGSSTEQHQHPGTAEGRPSIGGKASDALRVTATGSERAWSARRYSS